MSARKANDPALERQVAEIRLHARRRLGELSAALETVPSGRAAVSRSSAGTSKAEALAAAGLSKTEAHRCEQIARVPAEVYAEYIATKAAEGKAVTADEVTRIVGKRQRKAAGYLARLHCEQADPDELALIVSMLYGATLRGFCRVIEKAIGGRHA